MAPALGGGLVLLTGQLWQRGRERQLGRERVPPPLRRLAVTQTLLNLVGIGFGLSMLVPGVLPLPVIAGILILNGGLLTQLALILRQLDAITTPQA